MTEKKYFQYRISNRYFGFKKWKVVKKTIKTTKLHFIKTGFWIEFTFKTWHV